ncbi:hypothetical protein [Winogradskyella aurantiaca]|uniref:hypothetical protein n=1 Tax=Winogradskyella aurantiaca TaxID=2219558 RepID=UPI000E1D03EB|nr:hypothetical protein [Winogradskyella aurantiaca]
MKRNVAYLLSFLILVSCDNFWECLIKVNPEINELQIQQAYIDRPYSQFITAHITNEPSDDYYEYFFEVLGPLPEGLDIWYDYRSVEIFGIPKETGVYRLTVLLTIGAYDDGEYYDANPTCDGTTQRSFVLEVFD